MLHDTELVVSLRPVTVVGASNDEDPLLAKATASADASPVMFTLSVPESPPSAVYSM